MQSPRSGPSQAATTHLRPADEEPNVIDYLFDGMHSTDIYPVDPYEPVQLPMVSCEFRRLLSLYIYQRTGEMTPAKLFPEYRIGAGPEINQTGRSIMKLIVAILKELRLSSCASSRNIATRLRSINNRQGLIFLVDHMRAARGEQSLGILPTYNTIWGAIIEELQLSDNMSVLKVMDKYANSPPIVRLRDVLSEIDTARDTNTAMTIDVRNGLATTCPRLFISFPNVRVQPTFSIGELERDKTRTFLGEELARYSLLLWDARSLLQAIVESTTLDGFEAGKRHLEKYLRYAIKRSTTKALDAIQTITELEAVVYRVRALTEPLDALSLSPEYWAAALTNAALAMSRQFADSRAWLPIPDAVVHEPVGTIVAVPVLQPTIEFTVTYHNHTIEHLRGWMRLARRIYAPTALNGMIDHFYGSHELLMRQWATDRASYLPALNTSVLERLAKEYQRGLSLLWHLQDRFKVSANVVAPERRAALKQELQHFKKLEQAFKARLETNETFDFANLLDFTAAEAAMMDFSRELVRLDPWYRQAGQLPPEPPAIVPMAAAVEQALDELDAERMNIQEAALAADQAEVGTEQLANVENTVGPEEATLDQVNLLEQVESELSLFEEDIDEAGMPPGFDGDDDQQDQSTFDQDVNADEAQLPSATRPTATSRNNHWVPLGGRTLIQLAQERARGAREQQTTETEAGTSRSAGTLENPRQTGSSSANDGNSPVDYGTAATSESALRSARPVTLIEQEPDLNGSSVLHVSAPTAPTTIQTEEVVVATTFNHTSGIDLLRRLRGHATCHRTVAFP
ncbi:hypothetical protein, variant [Exophiala sideris]|uniref:Uncharacterized protein n=1 Tax=Exophiala sideris TaxID=1016849 RepID=A0A0D1VWJ3_9EURO|nr:hypothetical protein, variant [Exophiala sideris]